VKLARKWLIPLGGVALIGLLVILGSSRRSQPQYFTAKVERGDLRDAVEATGMVNAVVTVQVGSQVSGTILRLNADFNTRVKKGDIIAEIEPSVFQGALLQATADLESARANVEVALANLEKAKATLVQTRADYERNDRLARSEMISPQQLEAAKAAFDGATASVGAAQAGVTQARAMVSQKTAAVAVARTNLDHTVIRSPIDGIVVARSVDVGQTVAASLQAPTIFTIAQDLTKMRVYAKTDESDVGSIRAGLPVSFKVDAFPKDRFQGVVSQVRMNATVVQNVVTYDTVIEFENRDLKLFPGMTAYVTIPVASARNVLKVPNASLRYRPPVGADELRALFLKYGIAAEAGSPAAAPGQAVVWKLHADKSLEPVAVELGITDHAFTEVARLRKGDLKEGEELVTGSVTARPQSPGAPGIRR
jgi:HlyD family secretion protein